jgi:hypothetical protein
LDVEVAGARSKNKVMAGGVAENKSGEGLRSIDHEEKLRMDEREKMRGEKGTYHYPRSTNPRLDPPPKSNTIKDIRASCGRRLRVFVFAARTATRGADSPTHCWL